MIQYVISVAGAYDLDNLVNIKPPHKLELSHKIALSAKPLVRCSEEAILASSISPIMRPLAPPRWLTSHVRLLSIFSIAPFLSRFGRKRCPISAGRYNLPSSKFGMRINVVWSTPYADNCCMYMQRCLSICVCDVDLQFFKLVQSAAL